MATVVKDGYLYQKDGRYELNKSAQAFQGLDFITQINSEVAENIIKIEDLSRIDGDIDALGINRDTYKQILMLTLKSNSKENVLNIMHLLEKNPYIESAEPNLIIKDSTDIIELKTYDPYYDDNWGLDRINAPGAWDITIGSRQVKVGVIDRGIYYNHDDLEDNILRSEGRNFVTNPANNNTDGADDHGTLVAGVIGAKANNGTGCVGICWLVSIVPLRIWETSSDNEGWSETVIDRLVRAVNYATSNQIPILNMSSSHKYEYNAEKNVIEDYPGLFITTPGNHGKDIDDINDINKRRYPACYSLDNIIVVCATDQNDELMKIGEHLEDGDDSSWGKYSVDIAAPGKDVYSTTVPNLYRKVFGTSFAAPLVAGTAALIKTKYPGITTAQLKNAILNSARKPIVNNINLLKDKCFKEGILDAEAALNYASTHNSGGYLPEGVYYIKNVRSGKYLSVRTPTATVYSQSVQNNFTGGNEQKWRLENHYNYRVLIPLCNTDFKLTVGNGSASDGAKVKARAVPYGTLGSNWQISPYGSYGRFKLISQCSGLTKVLAVLNASTAPNADCIQYTFGTAQNDLWLFEYVPIP
jgi:subtilisin family serine protease